VIDFLVARYGEFVLLRPRFSVHTALLWLGPVTILLIGAGFLVLLAYRYRRRSRIQVATVEPTILTAAEQARLSAILRQSEPTG
jgi:cytochrome c-type biogenesis protein CcmH